MGTFPGDYSALMSIEEFVRQFMDGLLVETPRGKAIIDYTYTDNRTNDPLMVVTPALEANVMLARRHRYNIPPDGIPERDE